MTPATAAEAAAEDLTPTGAGAGAEIVNKGVAITLQFHPFPLWLYPSTTHH